MSPHVESPTAQRRRGTSRPAAPSGSTGHVRSGHRDVELAWSSRTHTGKVRQVNEDAVLCRPSMYLVADGMGGHECGDVAAALAVAHLRESLDVDHVDTAAVERAVAGANRRIFERGRSEQRSMGTTLTGLVPLPATAAIAVLNVGDSRTYRLSAGGLQQVTVDHSYVQELVDAGDLDPADAQHHPARNVVTRALGIDPEVEIDVIVVPLVEGDRFLVCSDGLSGELSPEWVARLLSAGSCDVAAGALLEATLGGPARDNVSLIVVDVLQVAMDATDDATDEMAGDVTDRRGDVTNRKEAVGVPELIDGVPTFETDGPDEPVD